MLKLLVSVDATSDSTDAVRHVIHRAWTREVLEVHLLHVRSPMRRTIDRVLGRADRSADAIAAAARMLDRSGLQYTAHVCDGHPAREIVRFAESNRFGGIVMASSRLGSLREVFPGSVTAKVIRTSRIPVEVVPPIRWPRSRTALKRLGIGAGIGALAIVVLD